MQFTECSVWEKTYIIDLPYLPFDDEEPVKEKIINESVKYIKRIKHINFRESNIEKIFQNERRFIFYQADTLIGLDISSLDVSAFTYLDQFFFLLKMYPLVLINSYAFTEDSLKRIALHSYCLEHRYILPTFGLIPFLDRALSNFYYKNDVIKLFKGEVDKINIEDFFSDKKEIQEMIDEITIRFPQVKTNGKEVFFQPQITWIGVSSKKIVELLNYLFNNNIVEFNYREMCEKFSIDELALLQYIDKSMLFYKKDDEMVIFRLQRKNIYWGFICNLAEQFEREMIERDAICYDVKIDEKLGTIKSIDERIYHKLGNLFLKCDGFSYKLFSLIKRILDKGRYTEILIVDNGNMNGLISMLQGSGLQEHIYEVIDYYGMAVKFPTIEYSRLKNRNVLVIIDIINTGKLIENVVEILQEVGCGEIGIFSFIINQNFSIRVLQNKFSDLKIELSYLMEKKLNIVKDILDQEYTKRFFKNRDLNFKLLWGEVGKGLLVNKHKNPVMTFIENHRHKQDFCDYNFQINMNEDKHSFIYQKFCRLINGYAVICVLKDIFGGKEFLEKIVIKEYEGNIKIIEIEERDISIFKIRKEFANKNVLFLLVKGYYYVHREKIQNFIQLNQINKADFFDLVELETYSLDEDVVVNDEDLKYEYIFTSKLKRFVGEKDNPEFDYLLQSYNETSIK